VSEAARIAMFNIMLTVGTIVFGMGLGRAVVADQRDNTRRRQVERREYLAALAGRCTCPCHGTAGTGAVAR
jgi:hypothetical protein